MAVNTRFVCSSRLKVCGWQTLFCGAHCWCRFGQCGKVPAAGQNRSELIALRLGIVLTFVCTSARARERSIFGNFFVFCLCFCDYTVFSKMLSMRSRYIDAQCVRKDWRPQDLLRNASTVLLHFICSSICWTPKVNVLCWSCFISPFIAFSQVGVEIFWK